MMKQIKNRYFTRIHNGKKIPRKYKKMILGEKQSKTKIKKRISLLELHMLQPFDNDYRQYFPSDMFCPNCGCNETIISHHNVPDPQEWSEEFCLRCGNKVCEVDNGALDHVLFNFMDLDWNNLKYKDVNPVIKGRNS